MLLTPQHSNLATDRKTTVIAVLSPDENTEVELSDQLVSFSLQCLHSQLSTFRRKRLRAEFHPVLQQEEATKRHLAGNNRHVMDSWYAGSCQWQWQQSDNINCSCFYSCWNSGRIGYSVQFLSQCAITAAVQHRKDMQYLPVCGWFTPLTKCKGALILQVVWVWLKPSMVMQCLHRCSWPAFYYRTLPKSPH